MKVIEAMKQVKKNTAKIDDLHRKIGKICANLSHETPEYGTETAKKVSEWLQSCDDLSQESARLQCAIQRTNLATQVTIEIGGKSVTKSISEWVLRRRKYATIDLATWSILTDRGLKEGSMSSSTGTPFEVKLVRHFDPSKRDEMMAMYRDEPYQIDSTLEVINATTEVIEA